MISFRLEFATLSAAFYATSFAAFSLMPCTAGAQVVQNQQAGSEWFEPMASMPSALNANARFVFDDKKLRMFIGNLQCDESQSLRSARN